MKSKTTAGVVAGLVAFGAASSASAAPVTVDLRVEGPTRTLAEQKVTVDVRPFKFSNSSQTYQCDGTGPSGSTTTPSPTRNGALAEASERTPFELTGTFGTFGASFERINGESVAFNSQTNEFLGEYKNGRFAEFGGCGDPVTNGDDVLYAYGDGSERLLRLAGPATVKPGESATLTVTDQADGQAVAGATVADRITDSNGRASTAPLTMRGPQAFKATKARAIRSNSVSVCVTDGADGFCGTTKPGDPPQPATMTTPPTASTCITTGDDGFCGTVDRRAPSGRIGSVREGQRFARGRGPRELSGSVGRDGTGIAKVELRLTRNDRGRCSFYDAGTERLRRMRWCGAARGRYFFVNDRSDWSYLLPGALPRGRYVLDLRVTDRAGNVDRTLQRTRNRVVFRVG